MVNIQKVTGRTKDEMKDLAKYAAEVGVELGRTTQEYLEAMTEFSRAGYGDNANSLAELSLLLQNVGDVSSETANEMLIAVDAAYDLNGSTSELTSVIDQLNEIANKNPTTVQKMSEAIKQSASVFKMAGLEVSQFASLVGTATSATQLGGSQVSRGLRTILLRMQGVTDEATDSTEESISKLDAVLLKYKVELRDSALEFKNPMEVLEQITTKFNTTLANNKVAQMEILNALAGKRQANIAASIINNWEMVQKQMYEAMYSTGSAMRENEIYMDSWKAKSSQLSSAVSQFWITSLNTDLIKGFIDGLRRAIETITDFGGLIPIIAGVLAGVLTFAIIKVNVAVTALGVKVAALNIGLGGLPAIIGLVTTALTALGYKYFYATDKINQYNTALTSTISKEADLLEQEDRHIDKVEEMVDVVEELGKKTDRTEEENLKLETVITNLNKLFPSMKTNIDKLSVSYDTYIGKIKAASEQERLALINKTKLAKVNAEAQLELASDSQLTAQQNYEKAVKKRNSTQSMILDVKDLASKGLFSTKKFTSNRSTPSDPNAPIVARPSRDVVEENTMFMDIFGARLKGIGASNDDIKTALSGGESGVRDLIKKINKKAQEDIIKFQPMAEELQGHIDTTKDADVTMNKILGLQLDEADGYEGGGGGFGTGTGSSDDTDIGSTAREVVIDQFYRQRQELELLNASLLKNKNILDSTTDDQDKLRLLQERINLLNQLRNPDTSPLTSFANDLRGQISQNLTKLKKDFNINGVFDKESGTLEFTNLERIYKFGDETKEIIDDLVKDTVDLKEEVVDLGGNWWSTNSEIISSMEEIERINKSIVDGKKKLVEQAQAQIEKNAELIQLQQEEAEKEIELIKEIYNERVEAVSEAELEIQKIIRKGIELKKDALDQEVTDLEKAMNKKIALRKEEWDAEDLKNKKEKDANIIGKIQKKIDALSRTSTLSGIAKRKQLEEELAQEKERIEEDSVQRRRDSQMKVLEDSITNKKENVDKQKQLLDSEWSNERIMLEARNTFIRGSFDSLKREFPELFKEMGNATTGFFDVFKAYTKTFNTDTTSMELGVTKVINKIKSAKIALDELSNKNTATNQSIQEDRDKSAIRDAQIEWNQLKALEDNGVASGSDIKRMKYLADKASGIRAKNNWNHSDLRNYKTKFGDLPQQNMPSNLSAFNISDRGALGSIGTPPIPSNIANNLINKQTVQSNTVAGTDMNFTMVIEGDVLNDAYVEKIKQAGDDITTRMRDEVRKKTGR